MPQLNLTILDMSLSSMLIFLVITDVCLVLTELDDQLLSYNNYILLTSLE